LGRCLDIAEGDTLPIRLKGVPRLDPWVSPASVGKIIVLFFAVALFFAIIIKKGGRNGE
jgi:hypothetical protein